MCRTSGDLAENAHKWRVSVHYKGSPPGDGFLGIALSGPGCPKPENAAAREGIRRLRVRTLVLNIALRVPARLVERGGPLSDRFSSLRHAVKPMPLDDAVQILKGIVGPVARISPFLLTEFIVAHLSRLQTEDMIQGLIDYLDATDAPFEDLEPEEDRCEAFDDLGGTRIEDVLPNYAADNASSSPRDAGSAQSRLGAA